MKTKKNYIGFNGIGRDQVTGNPRFNPTQFELHENITLLIEKEAKGDGYYREK